MPVAAVARGSWVTRASARVSDAPSAPVIVRRSSSGSRSAAWYVSSLDGNAPARTSSAKRSTASVASRAELGVAAHELRRHPVLEPEQVVEHEHLAVAVAAGADADRRHGNGVGDEPGDGVGHALEHDREAARPRRARPRRRRSRGAASRSLPCTWNPPSAWTDCGVSPRWPITGISASRIACTASRRLRPPSSFTAPAPARTSCAALRTVSSVDTW